ncbi:hypothetical protein evm_010974 [Chilo suppressalis]|nr:hypothetical protein evm_010974 [Chilo suppressalis]
MLAASHNASVTKLIQGNRYRLESKRWASLKKINASGQYRRALWSCPYVGALAECKSGILLSSRRTIAACLLVRL